MKIVFICNNYPPVIDGVGDYTCLLAQEMHTRGHEVHIICRKNALIEPHSTGIHIWPQVEKWTMKGFGHAAETIKLLNPDHILLQYVPYGFDKWGIPLGLPAIMKQVKKYCPSIILMVHEPYIRLQFLPIKTFITGQLQRFILQSLCRNSRSIITSIDLYKKLVGKFTDKPVVLSPIPSNIAPYDINEELLDQTRKDVAPSGQKIIVTFGIRDHLLLVNTFKRLLNYYPQVRLIIAGVVNDPDVYAGLEEYIHITGYQPADKIFLYLKAGDLFFLPDPILKETEGGTSNKSGSLAAALAAGLPVVGTKGDMNNTLLQKAPHIYLEPANPDLIAKKMSQLLGQLPLKGNEDFWRQYLSIGKVADSYELAFKL